jgi:adenine C2-methylase RlmN of 23S rRNA A2503 and tRNA A37
LPVYIRTPRGDDAAAACGQLAARPGEGMTGFFALAKSRQVS